MSDRERDDGWSRGWSGHRDAQLLRLAGLSLMEKLAWLEAAQETVAHLASQQLPVINAGQNTTPGPVPPPPRESR